MKKILVIEDEADIRTMLEYDLKSAGYDLTTAEEGKKGLELALSNEFDIIILDLLLPKVDGRIIAKTLKERDIRSHIIMLSALDDEFDRIKGLDIGADDYMTKPFSPRELTAKIRAVLRRMPQDDTEFLVFDDIHVDLRRYMVSICEKTVNFTQKEFDLLVYLIRNKERVLSRDQLLNTIWGYAYDGDSRVIDVHISKVRDKIADSIHSIETVRGVGYMLK